MAVVSVCIITYNQEKYLERCIEGALSQIVDFDFEIVIGDDFSNDRTKEISENYSHRFPNMIKYHRREKNLGMFGNWCESLHDCKGDYIALCEGDDYWTDPLKLQKQFNFLERNKDYVLCFHKAQLLKPNNIISDETEIIIPRNYEKLEDMVRSGNYIRTPTVFFRNVLKKEEIYNFQDTPIIDYPLYLLLGNYGKYGYLKDSMAVYRQGVGVWSSLSRKKSILGFTITLIYVKAYFSIRAEFILGDIIKDRIVFGLYSIIDDLSIKDFEPILSNEIINKELIEPLMIIACKKKKPNKILVIKAFLRMNIRRVIKLVGKDLNKKY
jgi:glycosyltransferase involved in cell wall biosynthesis